MKTRTTLEKKQTRKITNQKYYIKNREAISVNSVYYNMMDRCYNPNHAQYKDYGGRGIKVCERWRGDDGRKTFLADMGKRPTGYMLDRLNNECGYAPENCAWVTRKENQRNRRISVYTYINGEKMHYYDVSEMFGIRPETFLYRLKNGWSKDRLFQPAREKKMNKYKN